jgi:hypothetical protein
MTETDSSLRKSQFELEREKEYLTEYGKKIKPLIALGLGSIAIGAAVLASGDPKIVACYSIASGSIYILGTLANLMTAQEGAKHQGLMEVNPALPAHPQQHELLDKNFLKDECIHLIEGTLFPPFGIAVGIVKLGVAKDNFQLIRKVRQVEQI